MNKPCLNRTLAVALLATPFMSWAQPTAPTAARPPPRVATPAEMRDSAAVPGELRPSDPVVPQLKLPLGKAPPAAPLSAASAAQLRRMQAQGGIEDTAARCAAQASSSARAACRERLARAKPRP